MNIRLLTADDTETVAALERRCLPHPWTEDQIRTLATEEGRAGFVCEEEGTAAGYIGFSYVLDEAETGNLCVDPEMRRRGIGSELLDHAVSYLRTKGVRVLFLEVASRNTPAIRLYEKKGFETYNVRKGYYGDDDALLMRLPIGGEEDE